MGIKASGQDCSRVLYRLCSAQREVRRRNETKSTCRSWHPGAVPDPAEEEPLSPVGTKALSGLQQPCSGVSVTPVKSKAHCFAFT